MFQFQLFNSILKFDCQIQFSIPIFDINFQFLIKFLLESRIVQVPMRFKFFFKSKLLGFVRGSSQSIYINYNLKK